MFNSFLIKKQEQIALLKRLRLPHVLVDTQRSTQGILSTPAVPNLADSQDELTKLTAKLEQEKQAGIQELKEFRKSFKKHEREYADSISQLRTVNNKLPSRTKEAIQASKALVDQMTASLLKGSQVSLHLVNDDVTSGDPSYHQLNVTVLAMMLARQVGMTEEQIKEIGLGAMLHDCGKQMMPAALFSKKQPTLTERKERQRHTNLGYELLRAQPSISRSVSAMVSQHHEYLDGSGYPRGLKGSAIEPLAQLIAVVDLYDTLCHPDNPKQARPPGIVLGLMYKSFKEKLNTHYVQQFIKMMGVYPPGSIVQLSTKEFAMVTEVDSGNLLAPKVLVYDPSVPRQQAASVAIDGKEIKIERSLLASNLSPEALSYLSPRDRMTYFYDSQN